MIIHSLPAWVAATNCYIVEGSSGEGFLVDAPPDAETIGEAIEDLGIPIVGILLTHGHIDHTGAAGELSTRTGAVVYSHPDDDFLTLHPTQQLEMLFGTPPPGSYEVPETLTRLEDRQVLELAGEDIEVRLTPGHTPGHCCFYSDSEGAFFSGDQLFAGSIGRTDLPGGSYPDLMRSMRDRVMVLDDSIRVLPGHGPETTIGNERANNPFREGWQ